MPIRHQCVILLFLGTALALLGAYRPSFVLPTEVGSAALASPNSADQAARMGGASSHGAASLHLVLVAAAAACSLGLCAKLSITGRMRASLKTRRRFVDDGDGLRFVDDGDGLHHYHSFKEITQVWVFYKSFGAARSASSAGPDPEERASEQPQSSAGMHDVAEGEQEGASASQTQWPKLNAELANGRIALLAAGPRRQPLLASKPSSSGSPGFGFSRSSASSSTLPRRSCRVCRFATGTSTEAAATSPDAAEEIPPFEVALGEDGLPLDIDYNEELVTPVWDPADQIGVTAPLGFFDPLGFSKKGDEGREEFFKLRCAEIKHGRVAMMASVGLLAQHWLRFPGLEKVRIGLKPTIEATFTYPGAFYFSPIFLFLMFMELGPWTQVRTKEPGDFGDPFGIGMYDKDTRNRELNNGRFAMICTMAIIVTQLVTGQDAAQQLGFK